MALSQDHLDALDEAIATGARKVRFADGRETEFRSLAEMRSIREEIARTVDPVAARPTTTFIEHGRD